MNKYDLHKGVIIYGTTSAGEAIFQMCKQNNIPVVGYCDDSRKKVGIKFMDTTITSLADTAVRYSDIPIIIAIVAFHPIIKKIESSFRNEWLLCDELLSGVNYREYKYTRGNYYGVMEVENTIDAHRHCKSADGVYINNLDFIVTTKCSLRCRDCSNLMQYYGHPENFSEIELKQNLQNLLIYVSHINELRVIGGEPFMNPKLADILKFIIDESKVKQITVYSNGTIFPSEEQWEILSNRKVILNYTDYGTKLSRQIETIREETAQRNVKVYFHKSEQWTKCAEIKKFNRSVAELRTLYNKCCAKNLYTMMQGKIYTCPFIANAAKLGAIDVRSDECFDVDNNMQTTEQGREKLRSLLYGKDYLFACDFCLGRPFDAEPIEPAIQIKSPLEYEIYRTK